MDQLDRNLALSVGEGTELPILAFECIVGVAVAEFASIPTGVVELLNFVMGEGALVSLLAITIEFAFNMLITTEI